MRIKNVGRSTIIFNGGSLEAGKVAVFKDEAEKNRSRFFEGPYPTINGLRTTLKKKILLML